MAASLSDQNFLCADPGFIGRVRSSMVNTANTIKVESSTAVPFHREREAYAVGILNAPDNFKALFANIIAGDASVLADATAAGTVALTGGNVATQALNVTDAHINTAANNGFNSFFRTPGF